MGEYPLTVVILNGKNADNEKLRAAIMTLRDEGFPLKVRVTWEYGDGETYVQEAANRQATTVIAAGGDGTINEVATALARLAPENRPVLGLVPLGTANDFAISAGIPMEIENALRLAILGKATPIDLACVNKDRYFINMATSGFGTRITTETPGKLKSALGRASYFIHALIRINTLKADSCTLCGPNFHWQGDALVIGIGNGRQSGGGQRLCPTALINDGKLELCIATHQKLLQTLLYKLFSHKKNLNIITVSLPWLTIRALNQMTFNLDGEPLSGKEFHIEVIQNTVVCRLAQSCELLAS